MTNKSERMGLESNQHYGRTLLKCGQAGRTPNFSRQYLANSNHLIDRRARAAIEPDSYLTCGARLLIALSAFALANCGQSAIANDPSGFVEMSDASNRLLNDCVSTLAIRNGRQDAQAQLNAGKSPKLYGHIEGPESTALRAPGVDDCQIEDGRLAPLRLEFLKGKLDGIGLTATRSGDACLHHIYEYKRSFNLELLRNDPNRVRSACLVN